MLASVASCLFLLETAILSGCKALNPTSATHADYVITRYRRTHADSTAFVAGHIGTATAQKAIKSLSATLFVDGQRSIFYEADKNPSYLLHVSPGTHRLQIVTITYHNAEASFDVKLGDSLRIDFYLRPDLRPLY